MWLLVSLEVWANKEMPEKAKVKPRRKEKKCLSIGLWDLVVLIRRGQREEILEIWRRKGKKNSKHNHLCPGRHPRAHAGSQVSQ